MFHRLLAFLKEVCPLSLVSLAFSKYWFINFQYTKIMATLVIWCVRLVLM
jgi:hypothetical protein